MSFFRWKLFVTALGALQFNQFNRKRVTVLCLIHCSSFLSVRVSMGSSLNDLRDLFSHFKSSYCKTDSPNSSAGLSNSRFSCSVKFRMVCSCTILYGLNHRCYPKVTHFFTKTKPDIAVVFCWLLLGMLLQIACDCWPNINYSPKPSNLRPDQQTFFTKTEQISRRIIDDCYQADSFQQR